MVDLKAKPFFLSDAEIRWVEDTIASMTLDEKLGQLFVLLKGVPGTDENMIRGLMQGAPAGLRCIWKPLHRFAHMKITLFKREIIPFQRTEFTPTNTAEQR